MTEIQVIREDEKATAILKAIRLIDEGVEVGQVKHGRWVNNVDAYPECTECGYMPMYDPAVDDIWYSPYCPCCGAQMTLEDAHGQN